MHFTKTILLGILASVLSLSTFIFAEGENSSLLKGFDFSTKKSTTDFIDASFDHLSEIFSNSQTLSDTQKNELWNEHREKYVRWQGIVAYKGIGEHDWNRVGVRHNVGTNVEILFDYDKEKIVEMINKMDVITYTGKLSQLFNRNLMFELTDANIEKVNGISVENLIEKQQNNTKLSPQESIDTQNEEIPVPETESGNLSKASTDYTFSDLDRVFGSNSSLSFAQKEKLWTKYEGKSVRWKGFVTYKNTEETNLQRIGIMHTTGTNIELILDQEKTEKEVIEMIIRGDDITYTGKLAKLFGRNLLCSVVNVAIVKIGDKTFLENESERSAYQHPDLPVDGDQETNTASEIIKAESMAPKVIKKEDLEIVTTQEGFIETSFEELEAIFGSENRITESQKDKLWMEYKGKRVRWQGKVINRGLGRVSGLRMGVSHTETADVELCFNIDMKDKVLGTQPGDTVTYTGKLMNRRGYILPYRLEEGTLEEIIEVQQTTDQSP